MSEGVTLASALSSIALMPDERRQEALAVIALLASGYTANKLADCVVLMPPRVEEAISDE
ncbi:MAG: hypothetical protein RQ731_08085 [Anaerosomatales bacterium]|nr:hypothetical protein [Anaerosomatales bacterium]